MASRYSRKEVYFSATIKTCSYLSFFSVLDESTRGPVHRILNGFFIKMSEKFKYYYITTYRDTFSKLYNNYIVPYNDYFEAWFSIILGL